MSKNDQIRQAAEPLTQPGEVIEVVGEAVLGKFNVGKSVALGIATGIATMGLVSVMTSPVAQPIVVTTKRFIVLEIKKGIVDRPDSKIRLEIPRSEIRALPAKLGLTYSVDLTDVEGKKLTRMKFPFWRGGMAKSFAQALGDPSKVLGQA